MDASDLGLAVLNLAFKENVQIRFDNEEIQGITSGSLSINVREHLCIALAIWTWGEQWAKAAPSSIPHIRCWSDNASAVAWTNRWTSYCTESQEINRAIGLGEATPPQELGKNRTRPSGLTSLCPAAVRLSGRLVGRKIHPDVEPVDRLVQLQAVFTVATKQQDPAIVPTRTFAVFCWRHGLGRQQQGNSASTILSKISHISWNHQYQRGFSVGQLPRHKLAITGMRRHDRPSARKHPVTVQILRALHRLLNFSTTHDRVLWGAAVLGYLYLLRRSEYLASDRKSQLYAISRDDVTLLDDSNNRGDKPQVTHIAAALKRAAASVGEDPARFVSHPLRSGGATALFNAGVDSLAVKKFGRWKFDAVERYTVLKDDLTASLARSMLGKHA
ncbi:hypothetical protein ON010_g6603 [Phytophthora cinnamomi]|nr:hypothetical protein ON010_g6603 [Phytophthora cinnamomi]